MPGADTINVSTGACLSATAARLGEARSNRIRHVRENGFDYFVPHFVVPHIRQAGPETEF
jgi:hypothetical protein